MPAHLVETSEEDSFQAVANLIADLLDEGQVRRLPIPSTASKLYCGGCFLKISSSPVCGKLAKACESFRKAAQAASART